MQRLMKPQIRGENLTLQQLDAYQPSSKTGTLADNAEARLEAAIAARRGEMSLPSSPSNSGVRAAAASPDDDLEVLIAGRRREKKEKAAGFCPQCGNPVQVSDRFCPKCGAEIHQEA